MSSKVIHLFLLIKNGYQSYNIMENIYNWEEFNEAYNKPRAGGKKRWSVKYKKSIDCNNPKGFSQKVRVSKTGVV